MELYVYIDGLTSAIHIRRCNRWLHDVDAKDYKFFVDDICMLVVPDNKILAICRIDTFSKYALQS